MPIYQDENNTKDKLEQIRRTSTCSVCGANLYYFYNPDTQKRYLACNDYLRTQHEGIQREAEYKQLNIEGGKKFMSEQYGMEVAKKLSDYQLVPTVTKDIAEKIVNTLWPDYPMEQRAKAIMLCWQYNLNPLARHIHILKFASYKKDRSPNGDRIFDHWEYAVVFGIQAKRLNVHRKHSFTFLDDTPRVATDAELEKILGKENIDRSKLYCITKIRDLKTQAECYGIGSWPKGTEPYGTDKGNTKNNMAMIRSERQCYDKLYPEEMFDRSVDVIDESFIEVPSKSIIEEKPAPAEPSSDEAVPPMFADIYPEKEESADINFDEPKGFVDLDWLVKTLAILKEKKVRSWNNIRTLEYLVKTYHLENKNPRTPSEAARYLTETQAGEFVKYLNSILESA